MTAISIDLSRTKRALSQSHAGDQAHLERIECELRFCSMLCDLHPDQRATWVPLIEQARTRFETSSVGDSTVISRVLAAEAILAPIALTAKSYRIYGIGHAHIDMNWQWSWPETVGIVHDTFVTVLTLMEEFPEFHFTQSQAEIYRILEEHAPELLARIAVHVKAGRWEVAASHWVEGDKNLASGESLCRQVLYAKNYLQRLFGFTPDGLSIDWAPDTFGHSATMPTYLQQSGVKFSFLHRPGAHAEKWPQAFRWHGPDESEILVFNGMRGGYNGVFCPRMILDRIGSWHTETSLRFAPFIFGVGDHGGGPTRRDLLRFREIQQWPIFPELVLSSAYKFFTELDSVRTRLPIIKQELNFAFTGCYTSQSVLKRANRLGENRLDDAERAAACSASVLKHAYPATRLEGAWRNILFSQFHDILPGSCVHDSRTYSHGLFQQSMATTSQIETQSLRALAAVIATDEHATQTSSPAVIPFNLRSGFSGGAGHGTTHGDQSLADGSVTGDDREFVLFHLDQGDRQEVVEATVWENARDYANIPFHRQQFSVQMSGGAPALTQILDKGTAWGHDFVRMAFPASIASLGYIHCTVSETNSGLSAPATGAWQLGRDDFPAIYSFHDLTLEGIENALLRVEIEPKTGGIRRLVDKRTGHDLVSPDNPASVLEYGIERPHSMNSWAIDHAHDLKAPTCTGMRRVGNGPYIAALEVTFTVAASEFTVTYELRQGDPRLHIRIRSTWREIGSPTVGVPFIRLAIATTLAEAKLTCEIPFGSRERSFNAGEEVPGLQWGLLQGKVTDKQSTAGAGLLLLNDSKYGHALETIQGMSTLRLNLIRSTYDPDPLPEVGQHVINVALMPVSGEVTIPEAVRAGRAFNHPVRVVGTSRHTGRLPAAGHLLQVEPAALTVLAIKRPESGVDALILRLNNPTGIDLQVSVKAGSALGRLLSSGQLVDVMEQPIPGSALLKPESIGVLRVTVPAFGLCSLRVDLGAA